MDTKVERTKTNRKMEGLRTRVGTKMEDEDECQSTQKSFGRSSRIKTAQDDLAKGMEGAQPFKSDGSPTLTPGMSTPKSMSPSPPANGCLANFGVIIPGVYRSAWPTADGYEFMRGLRLKTIITLVVKEEPDTEYAAFIKENSIRQLVFDIDGTKKASIPAETMREVLRAVLDKTNHPVLVHCNRGRHRTGCIVGVLRKLYGWDLATVLSEYHSFANPKPRDTDIKYLTTVEPAKLFANAQEDAPMHARGPFSRLFSFALFATMIWFVTMYQIASKMPEKHHA
ncbi:hypothetical protein VUR80DRAFT_5212 [Thermomyces stellatus]